MVQLNRINKDVLNLIYLEIHKFRTHKVHLEMKSLMYYADNIGLCDLSVNKRFNWRKLENTSNKSFDGSPIYSEIMFIGKISELSENECVKNRSIPPRYTYSIGDER